MKKKSKPDLKLQRQILVQRSALLREQIAHEMSAKVQPRLRLADSAFDAVDWARANPAVVMAVLGTLFVLRPKRTMALGFKAWGLWRVGSRVLPMLRVLNTMRRLRR